VSSWGGSDAIAEWRAIIDTQEVHRARPLSKSIGYEKGNIANARAPFPAGIAGHVRPGE
jgi:hypothetical protein